MKEKRAITLLKSLDKDELRWFQKFVQSPYHNANNSLVTLYGCLRKLHPEYPSDKTSPEVLYKLIFPRKAFDAPTIRLLMHRLANLLEDFLVGEQIKHDMVIREKLLVRSLGGRNAYGLFEKKTRRLLNELDAKPGQDANYYRHKSDLQLQYYGHPATDRHSKKSEDLQAGMRNLDTYFTLNKLRLASGVIARKNTLAEETEIPYMNAVLAQVDETHPLARLYHQAFVLQTTPDDIKVFEDLRNHFIGNIALFNLEDKRLVLSVLLNFCTRKYNQGALEFSKESFRLYKLGIEADCMLYNGEITYVTYSNIASLAVVNKEFAWGLKFLNDYAPYLDESIREEAKAYSLGSFYFYQKKFEQAYDLLQAYNFSKKQIQILAKSLLVRVNIELFLKDRSYYDLANTQLNNLEKYVRNIFPNAPIKVEQYMNFIKYTRKFLKLKDSGQSMVTLVKKVEQSKNLTLKKWLVEKLKE